MKPAFIGGCVCSARRISARTRNASPRPPRYGVRARAATRTERWVAHHEQALRHATIGRVRKRARIRAGRRR